MICLNSMIAFEGNSDDKPLLVLAILGLVEPGLVGAEGVVHKDAQLNLRFRYSAGATHT